LLDAGRIFTQLFLMSLLLLFHASQPQVPLEDDQIFLHYGEAEFVAAKAKGKSAAQAYYMPSPVRAGSTQHQAVHSRPACVCCSVSFACMLHLPCSSAGVIQLF
jgi:hypothetical protein